MKKIIALSFVAAVVLASCITMGSNIKDYFFLHGAILEEGPMKYVFTAPDGNALAFRKVDTYKEKMHCEFSLQRFEDNDILNGFVVLADQGNPVNTIIAGVYIGAREYAIEGSGVNEPIRVPVDFDQAQVFTFSILIDFKRGNIEMKTNDREISTSLAPHMKQVDMVGYHAKSTKTHFSDITIKGR